MHSSNLSSLDIRDQAWKGPEGVSHLQDQVAPVAWSSLPQSLAMTFWGVPYAQLTDEDSSLFTDESG